MMVREMFTLGGLIPIGRFTPIVGIVLVLRKDGKKLYRSTPNFLKISLFLQELNTTIIMIAVGLLIGMHINQINTFFKNVHGHHPKFRWSRLKLFCKENMSQLKKNKIWISYWANGIWLVHRSKKNAPVWLPLFINTVGICSTSAPLILEARFIKLRIILLKKWIPISKYLWWTRMSLHTKWLDTPWESATTIS